jgi:type IV secretory pathway VirB10-like protein
MILADISGQFIFFIVFAAIGVINWWLEKKKKEAESDSAPPPNRPPRAPREPSGTDSEEERLRRFMEALGVPQPPRQSPMQAPPRQKPATPVPAPRLRPVPRPAAQTMERRLQSPKPAARAFPPPKPARSPQPEEFQKAGRIEEAASSIERISGEFEQMNVRVAMPPVQPLETPAHLASAFAGTTSVLTRQGSPIAVSLRAMLHKPADLRAAFVAMELLGPPRGLQC